jgi:hypothetical protein
LGSDYLKETEYYQFEGIEYNGVLSEPRVMLEVWHVFYTNDYGRSMACYPHQELG